MENQISMERCVYRSAIDLWVWPVVIGTPALSFLVAWDDWVTGGILAVGQAVLFAVLMLGCWYEIDCGDLVVYQFFRPTRIPISKIRDVRKTTGYLATAGMSRLRVSISFTDRSVMKSSMPLEISPGDRDGFIARLIEINPDIHEV